MKPVNNKSLLAFIFDQMDKLDKKEIDVEHAKAQANLAKQANNSMRYEIDLVKLRMQLKQHNNEYNDAIEIRNVESKNFD